jgi:beta-N-acetylhexosaminidase
VSRARRAGLRRLALLGLAALGAAVAGGALGAHGVGAPGRGRAESWPARPSPAPDPGAVVLLSFDGTRAPAYVARILRRREAAGVFLSPANVTSPAQLRALTTALRRAGGPGVLVATDQEGGAVRALPWAGPVAPPAAGPPAHIEADHLNAARALRAAGVGVDFAPVTDIPSVPGAFIRPRAYAGGAAAAAAAVAGLRAGGVAATAKHFPGLGAATVSTDAAPVTLPGPTGDDLGPFRAAIGAGVPLVMVSSARYPALDPHHIASQSPATVDGLLRRRLHFRGAAVTDSLEARAVLDGSSLEGAAVASLRAGCDLLLTTGPSSWIRVRRALAAAVSDSPALEARLRQAAGRVAALRRSLR